MANPNDVTLAQTMYDMYIEAEKTVMKGQAYSIGDRTLTRVDLRWIAEQREKWGNTLLQLQNGTTANGIKIQRVLPRGFI